MSESLRIGYLTSAFARPSDTFIRNEVNQLRQLGVDVATFSIRRPESDGESEEDVRRHQASTEYLLEAGYLAIACRALLQVIAHPWRFVRAARLACRTSAPGIRGAVLQGVYLIEALYLAGRMRNRGIELLHNHIGENSATVAMLAAEFSRIPFSLTIHGPYIFYAPARWALSEKLASSAFTACISDFCRSQCLIFAPESAWPRIHVVRCSVQPAFVETVVDRRPPSEPHFLCVGRLCTEKGQALLIDATGRLADGGCRVQVSLVGDGPRRASLEHQIRELGLEESVRILGWQSSQRIRELMLESTALVISSFAEGLPLVAMEALALRLPVIATNIAAMSELIEHQRSGWLISPGSVELLASAMREASACSPEKLQAMGNVGRERVLDRHQPAQQARKLRDLFISVIRKPNDGLS